MYIAVTKEQVSQEYTVAWYSAQFVPLTQKVQSVGLQWSVDHNV